MENGRVPSVANTLALTPIMDKKNRKRAKIHHYVPQALQKWFRDDFERIWYSERGPKGHFCAPEPRNTASTFKRRDYYTIIENGVLSDKIEREFYGPLDNLLSDFLLEIHQILDEGAIPEILGESLTSLKRLFYHLITRNPESTEELDDYELGKEYFARLIADSGGEELQSPKNATLRERFGNDVTLRNEGRSIRVYAQASSSKIFDEFFKDFTLRFIQLSGKHSLVLASPCVYRIDSSGNGSIANPDVELWLPISPKRALVLLKDPLRRIPLVINDSREHVRSVNEFAVRNSIGVASHSKTLLESLLR